MTYRALIYCEKIDGLNIEFYACEENTSPADSFVLPKEDMDKLFADILKGDLVWFCAEVTASKNGIKLASDYLGCCCYKSTEEFYKEKDGYYADMVATVIEEAKTAIAGLTA